MFASYKKHNTKLYNKLVELSRNKFFYEDLSLQDNFQSRVMLIFFHFIIILKTKKNKEFKKVFQSMFDNIFQNIEINIRELGYGDTKVNKTMKDLNKIFYDIIQKLDEKSTMVFQSNTSIINKYFYENKNQDMEKSDKLANYLQEFQNYCFDLDINNVLNGSIDFKFKQ